MLVDENIKRSERMRWLSTLERTVKICNYRSSTYEYFCHCGYYNKTSIKGEFKCPTCGNEKLITLSDRLKMKIVYSNIYVVEKDDKSFHLAKDKIRIAFDYNNNTAIFKPCGKVQLRYDLRHKKVEIKKKELWECASEKVIDYFFKNSRRAEFVDLASTEKNRVLYMFAWNYLSIEGYREYTKTAGKALMRLLKYPYFEMMFYAGFDTEDHLREIKNECKFNVFIPTATNPQDLLGVNKVIIPIAKKINKVSEANILSLKKLYNIVGGNNFKIIFETLSDEMELKELNTPSFCINFCELYKMGYTNVKKLSEYASREVKLQQGIDQPATALMYLKDYVKMTEELDHRLEKYPKSLKKVHDISTLNYRIHENEIVARKFKSVIDSEEYRYLSYRDKNHSIVIPSSMESVIKEGEFLGHCVASYINDISKGLCKIVFLRKNESIEKPYITIEVRGNVIRQAQGIGNRYTTEQEKSIISLWGENKGLQCFI